MKTPFLSIVPMVVTLSFLGSVLSLLGCGGESAASASDSGRLMLTGSSTIAPVIAEIAKRYEKAHDGIRIDVQTGGSSRGITDAREGRADIGMSSRALRDDEIAGLASHTFAWDGVGFVVHASNSVRTLSDTQIRDIFTGRIQNWSEVGGQDAEIVVVNRADGRSELELVTEYWGIDSRDIEADVIGGENQQVVKTLAANVHAISYLSIGTCEYEMSRGTELALLPLGGIAASSETVQAGTYPLARPLILLRDENQDGLIREFIDYAMSAGVHDLILSQSFVPVDP